MIWHALAAVRGGHLHGQEEGRGTIMHPARDVDARRVMVAGAIVGWACFVTACASHLDALREHWAKVRDGQGGPCDDAADCRALLERLERAKREACGEASPCEATAELEAEIRPAVLAKFKRPCESGDARACIDAFEFGYEDGLRVACELGSAKGCVAACAQRGEEAAKRCMPVAESLERLTGKCAFKHEDTGDACQQLGVLVNLMSAAAPAQPPLVAANPVIYATPLLEDRARSRYALDYFSRACHLGVPAGCIALCKRRPFDETTDLQACRRIAETETAKSLRAACRKRDGKACYDLALLSSNMGFFDRDPAGFYISGPGRVVGLKALACQLGVQESCVGEQPF